MESLLDLDNDGVKMVAITGPAGIGKTTIARALQSQIYNRFHLTCFVDNLRGSYLSDLDVLRLQEQFLSNVLNQDAIRIRHSGVIKERLCKQRVLIMLDDVNHLKQLEALANETTWFGSGSRIVVTTENKEILQQHGIDNMYHVGFPTDEEAVKILCSYAFRKESTYSGFKELAIRVTKLCGNLPLGLHVVGSSLHGKNEEEWKEVIRRLETILEHQDIEEVLRVGYESLHENEQSLFLHIAVFFNYKDIDLVKAMFADSDLDVKHGLKILENRSLIEIFTHAKRIEMHILIAQVGKKAIYKQEPWKRQILIDADEICDVLEDAKGTRDVLGISFDISGVYEVSISKKAFKKMHNLRFLRVYKGKDDGNYNMHHTNVYTTNYNMSGCSRLRNIPVISTNITQMFIQRTAVEGVPPSIRLCSSLNRLCMSSSGTLEGLTHLPPSVMTLDLSYSDIQKIPDCIKALPGLQTLDISCCRRLASLPELPGSLKSILAKDCESLETVSCPLSNPNADFHFANCFKLDQQARRAIIQRSFRQIGSALLPGREIPAEFNQLAKGNCLTIRPDGNCVAICLFISYSQKTTFPPPTSLLCRRRIGQGDPVDRLIYDNNFVKFQSEHLFIFDFPWLSIDPSEISREVTFEFNCRFDCLDVIECGAKIWTNEGMEGSYESGSDQVFDGDTEFEPSKTFEYKEPTNLDGEIHTNCWSWLFLCFGSLGFGKEMIESI